MCEQADGGGAEEGLISITIFREICPVRHRYDKEQLLLLLDEAIKLSAEFSGGYSNEFLSAEDFHTALSDSVEKFKNGDLNQVYKLYLWFLPTSQWDNFIGGDGQDVANEICSILSKYA